MIIEVLSAIQIGEKLSMTDNCFTLQPKGYLQPIQRKWNGDNRWINLNDIKKIGDKRNWFNLTDKEKETALSNEKRWKDRRITEMMQEIRILKGK